ncbi:MAG TPA: DUF5916 domain-containing protein [Holophagaceae bacterium]|nr:DUF5916 domain-containing protein [Holophagaceae bacterium]
MTRHLLATLLAALPLLAAPLQAPARTTLHPTRTDHPPVIDGVLDDPVWATATSVTDFQTFIPEFGKVQPERTVAYMAYDRENLYFAYRCYDPHPELIKAAVSRRDDVMTDDFVCINLDTFNDQQSLYAFYVNPFGIQGDSRFASGKEDFSIDLVWESAGRIDAEGYTVEMKIPLKSIRYTSGDVVRMSVLFERNISRRQEHGSFPILDPKAGYAFLPQMAPLEYVGLAPASLVELLPAFTYARHATRNATGTMVQEPDKKELSLTAKVGLTSSLTLDATINPDFSQVEADAGQVDANLRYGLFYAEKRPFFLEGMENFNVGATSNSPLLTVLHTRTIVDPKYGVKLTGKVDPTDTVALLHARDTGQPAAPGDPAPDDPLVSAVRFKHALKDDGYVGIFWTDREQGPRRNQVVGPDGQLRLTPSDLLGFHAFGSNTRPEGGGGDQDGKALGLEYLHDTSTLAINAGLHTVSSAFQTDTGYLTRTGFSSANVSLTPRLYPQLGWIRRLDPVVGFTALRDFESDRTEQDRTVGLTAIFKRNASLSLLIDDSTEIFQQQRFRTDGVTLSGKNQFNKAFTLSAKFRVGKAIWYDDNPLQARGSQATVQAVLQPTDTLNFTLSWIHSVLVRDDTGDPLLNYSISRIRATWQPSEHFFLRAIGEYNAYYRQLRQDYLAAYTYVPGTVVYLGYGTLDKKTVWVPVPGEYRNSDHFLEMQRGLFFKASYLYRF